MYIKSFNTGNKNFSVGCYYYRYYDVYMYNEYIKYEIILHLLSLVKVSLRRKSVSVNLTITRSFTTSWKNFKRDRLYKKIMMLGHDQTVDIFRW